MQMPVTGRQDSVSILGYPLVDHALLLGGKRWGRIFLAAKALFPTQNTEYLLGLCLPLEGKYSRNGHQ